MQSRRQGPTLGNKRMYSVIMQSEKVGGNIFFSFLLSKYCGLACVPSFFRAVNISLQ